MAHENSAEAVYQESRRAKFRILSEVFAISSRPASFMIDLSSQYGPNWKAQIEAGFRDTHPETALNPDNGLNELIVNAAVSVGYRIGEPKMVQGMSDPLVDLLVTMPHVSEPELRIKLAAYIEAGAQIAKGELASAGMKVDLSKIFHKSPVPSVFYK